MPGYPLPMPGSWAVLLGTLMRTGVDVSGADPIQAIERLDGRPVLLLDAGQDASIGASDAGPAGGRRGGRVIGRPGRVRRAGHAGAPEACPEDYAAGC